MCAIKFDIITQYHCHLHIFSIIKPQRTFFEYFEGISISTLQEFYICTIKQSKCHEFCRHKEMCNWIWRHPDNIFKLFTCILLFWYRIDWFLKSMKYFKINILILGRIPGWQWTIILPNQQHIRAKWNGTEASKVKIMNMLDKKKFLDRK